ncbi:MAG: DUF1987 domain-containing protein [Bacteroidales bacterium]|nr:DUF1987 domain-containing protein [Bacteroidales bacterium]
MIDKLYLKGSEEVPEINFNATTGKLEISGRSIPENANIVFSPVLSWLNLFFEKPNTEITLVLKLEYINSSSTKKIIEILLLLEKQFEKGSKIKVEWFYKTIDLSMEKKISELLGLFKIPSEIKVY